MANGLTEDETDAIRRKRLLGLLNQVDDDASILLRAYGDSYAVGGRDAWEKVWRPSPAHMGSSQDEIDDNNLYSLGKDLLIKLGLLKGKYVLRDKFPVFDPNKKKFKVTVEISPLGKLLLKQVGQSAPFDAKS